MEMKIKLLIQALTKFIAGVFLIGILLFLPVGTLCFPKAWFLMAVLFIPMLLMGIILWLSSPELLSKRLNSKEKETEQKAVVGLSLLMFLVGFIVTGLDFRYGWSKLPDWVSAAAAVVLLISYGLYGEVMRENTYLSRTVEVQEGQKVIDTGFYGIVRHPMYFSSLFLCLSMPLICGSVYGFLVFLLYPVLLVKRIRNEEEVLRKELDGYEEYRNKVRCRLIPYIW